MIALPGDRFGRWTVLAEAEARPKPDGRRRRRVICACDCGTIRTAVEVENLRSSKSLSCGCLAAETSQRRFETHGHNVGGRRTPPSRRGAPCSTAAPSRPT
jgi:hypothetical protein